MSEFSLTEINERISQESSFIDEIKRKNSDLAHKFISIKDLEI